MRKVFFQSGLFIFFHLWVHSNLVAHPVKPAVQFEFYGHLISLPLDTAIKNTFNEKVRGSSFELFYNNMQKTDYRLLLKKLKKAKKQFNLDDFGFLLLLKKYTEEAFSDKSQNFKNLFNWFFLVNSKFDVFISYRNDTLRACGTFNIIYGTDGIKYRIKNNTEYYDITFKRNQRYSEEYTYFHKSNKKAKKTIKIDYSNIPKLGNDIVEKKFKFAHQGIDYNFTIKINKSLAEYFNDLPPMIGNKIHVGYGFSDEVKNTFIKQLKDILKNKSLEESINFLLAFCQYAISHKPDNDYWGHEKQSFPEEVLYWEYSDCEDKSILFAALVKELFGIKSVCFDYRGKDGHANIGIDLEKLNKLDDSWILREHDGKKYVVCDPTWEGHTIGKMKEKSELKYNMAIPLF